MAAAVAVRSALMGPVIVENLANSSRCAAVCHHNAGMLRARVRPEHAMPEALELLKTRRSLKPVELITPWRFIVFEGDARRKAGEAIATVFKANYPDATDENVAFERERLARAPLVVAVVSRAGPHVKIPEWEQVLSAGAAAMNLVTAAHALGFGATWITEWYAYDRRVLDALGLSASEKIAGFVHVGRPKQPPEDRPRPPLAEIVTKFGS
jgi:nitroreductase